MIRIILVFSACNNHNAYYLLLFYRKIEIWVELMKGYDKSKVDKFKWDILSDFQTLCICKDLKALLWRPTGGSSKGLFSTSLLISYSEGSFDVKPSTPRSTTCTGPRSSNAASTASASAAGNNSIYYYSDTLRKGRVGSDSGISVDTPPPRLQSTIRGQNNRGLVQTEAVLTERKRLRRLHDTKVWQIIAS